ncbi:hypothetical protein [Corynebacterium belfantii]|uniref:hypothetical protein n=1 Tax=Corynebacterium belfantii TaxID=2014537 RepID=UPI0018D46555|nr:hypothetical protein [Corynebacterium belfantii]MBG9260269.1 hypothetical protein [Corynebacterium belfantii]MBG9266992.1 hypothetical protein [Corynebacterium belfantii]MBG9330181.1 hypothetical protein [Corynebacterium belfantii]
MTDIQIAVSRALTAQPWYVRRKDTIAAAAGLILQVLNIIGGIQVGQPAWVSMVIAAAIGLAQICVHAGTQGAITPSMGERLEATAPVNLALDLDEARNSLAESAG